MSIYLKIPVNSSLDVNGTHVLAVFYWKIIGNMVVPLTVWKLLQLSVCSIHEIGQGFISSLFWIEGGGKEWNLSQMEHFLNFIDISLLKCFSAVKENAHNLAITWFRWLN